MIIARTLVTAIVMASAVAAGGCGVGVGESPGAIDVADDVYVVSDGRVTTPCFAFDLPAKVDYAVIPGSEGCIADLNLPHRDLLTVMLVRAEVGGFDPERFAAKTSQFEVLEPLEQVVVDGKEAWRIRVEDSLGLPVTMGVVLLPPGRFEEDGEPLTSVMISTHTGAPELQQAFDEVVGSFHILD